MGEYNPRKNEFLEWEIRELEKDLEKKDDLVWRLVSIISYIFGLLMGWVIIFLLAKNGLLI